MFKIIKLPKFNIIIVRFYIREIGIDNIASLVASIKKQLNSIFKERKCHVILDFKDIIKIDSTALGMMINIYKKMKELKCYIVLANVTPFIDRVIRSTGLDEYIRLFSNKRDAMKWLLAKIEVGGLDRDGTA